MLVLATPGHLYVLTCRRHRLAHVRRAEKCKRFLDAPQFYQCIDLVGPQGFNVLGFLGLCTISIP
jgi:hypothetical protein